MRLNAQVKTEAFLSAIKSHLMSSDLIICSLTSLKRKEKERTLPERSWYRTLQIHSWGAKDINTE